MWEVISDIEAGRVSVTGGNERREFDQKMFLSSTLFKVFYSTCFVLFRTYAKVLDAVLKNMENYLLKIFL